MLISILYNPECANALRTPEQMDPQVVRAFAQTIYNEELLNLVATDLHGFNKRTQSVVRECILTVRQANQVELQPVSPLKVQVVSKSPPRKGHKAADDTAQTFVAKIPDPSSPIVESTQKQDMINFPTIDRTPPSVIKSYQIPDRTYDQVLRRRVTDIRQRGQRGVPVVIVQPIDQPANERPPS